MKVEKRLDRAEHLNAKHERYIIQIFERLKALENKPDASR